MGFRADPAVAAPAFAGASICQQEVASIGIGRPSELRTSINSKAHAEQLPMLDDCSASSNTDRVAEYLSILERAA